MLVYICNIALNVTAIFPLMCENKLKQTRYVVSIGTIKVNALLVT
jgi:hypothetical protein